VPLSVSIIGAGPGGLMLGCFLDPRKFTVTIYEQNAAPGRKFLVAGDGGLNLTHSEDPQSFIERYTPAEFLRDAFSTFNNKDLVTWFNSIGVKTFTGSSGRVFPEKNIKPIQVLNALLAVLEKKQVSLLTRHRWKGFDRDNALIFENKDGSAILKSDITVLCMGGASWPVTGSTGAWLSFLKEKQIQVLPFESSNCAFKIGWKESILKNIQGKPLKNITVTCDNKTHAGEVVLTAFGMEGSGVYPLSPQIRKRLRKFGYAEILIDLKPALSRERILEKILINDETVSYTGRLKKQLNLTSVQIALLKELVEKKDFMDPQKLSGYIKALPLKVTDTAPLSEAISSTGGLSLGEINQNFMLKKMPGLYAIGEMLDYDAPTGGYLLQSCFSMGYYVARILNKL
jgi:uncharacterized flavoprotein (TIGR03862 family)